MTSLVRAFVRPSVRLFSSKSVVNVDNVDVQQVIRTMECASTCTGNDDDAGNHGGLDPADADAEAAPVLLASRLVSATSQRNMLE